MKRSWLGFMLSMACFTASSVTVRGDGNELLFSCAALVQAMNENSLGGSDYNAGYCLGLVHGVLDITGSTQDIGFKACAPDGITMGQAVRVVEKYLQSNPKELHRRDTELTIVALKDAYPCSE